MRSVIALAWILGCGGPSQQQVVESPAATERQPATSAPPASTSDLDRERLKQSFDDMETTQQAYREANGANQAPPAQPVPGQPPPPTLKKKGVAEQAPPEPPKKKGVAEQAPTEPPKQ